ncbi:hypothetical protein [Oryzobacter faecalis]|uniref:hypothetical protein n=1 Tax=Oryzobacter faecalis TaxID=3388656 RepID=UPI00398CF776
MHQLTLVADERSYDLVVPVGTRVTDVLSVLGISSSANPSSVATSAGHVFGPHDRLGEDLPAGSVLTVVRTTTHQVTRDVVSIDRSSSAPGGRTDGAGGRRRGPAWAGGGRTRPTTVDPVVVDDSTRRRDDLDEATVSRASLRAGAAAGSGVRVPRSGRARSATRPEVVGPALVVGTGLLCLAGSVLVLLLPAVSGGPGAGGSGAGGLLAAAPVRWASALLLLASAVLVTLAVPRDRTGSAAVRLAAAPALAVAAGLLAPFGESPQGTAVQGALACGLGVVVLALGSTDGPTTDRGERTAMACLGGVGMLLAAGVLLDWSPVATAALVVGAAPVLVRALPSTSLSVDPTQLVDTDRLSTTIWAVRERHAGRRRRVTAHDVRDRVAAARAVVSAGTGYAAVLAALGGWVVALAAPLSDIAPWSRWVLPAVAAVALGYQARTVRDRVARFAMLGGSASLTVASAVAVLAAHPMWVVWLVLGTVGVASATLVAAVALSGGYHSTRMSRLADRIESLAVVLVLPLGVLAAGGVEGLRRLTSG